MRREHDEYESCLRSLSELRATLVLGTRQPLWARVSRSGHASAADATLALGSIGRRAGLLREVVVVGGGIHCSRRCPRTSSPPPSESTPPLGEEATDCHGALGRGQDGGRRVERRAHHRGYNRPRHRLAPAHRAAAHRARGSQHCFLCLYLCVGNSCVFCVFCAFLCVRISCVFCVFNARGGQRARVCGWVCCVARKRACGRRGRHGRPGRAVRR